MLLFTSRVPKSLCAVQQQATFLRKYRRQQEDYSEHFDVLGINPNSDEATAREAFLKLAKKFHPDSGHPQADTAKFHLVEKSYRKLLQKFSSDRKKADDCEGEFGLYYEEKKASRQEEDDEEDNRKFYDIKHTKLQHRQFLSNEGIGMGTPAQRQKQFEKYQLLRATENVVDFKVQQLSALHPETAVVSKEKAAAKKIRTRYGIERVVEDLIQESMSRGDFDKLSLAGKPLQYQNHNPYVDVVTHKLNQVLIDNGYAPEWVLLEKEIRVNKETIREMLEKERAKLGSYPLSSRDQARWEKNLQNIKEDIDSLNKKINHYNLVVPLLAKQMCHFPFAKEAEKILKNGKIKTREHKESIKSLPNSESNVNMNLNTGFFSFFNMFKQGSK
ncbi:dnaJ homolog subfamily C member 28 [Oratosquilla oratoria]|uniref:dnaJ homolog subfamily C member 28 n=1 Tax=Oratosquilla oratoria TaxID=337810 RepID=UPI003F76DC6F